MKLFRVEVQRTIYLLAEDRREARLQGVPFSSEEEPDLVVIHEITDLNQVMPTWIDAIAYGQKGDKTVRQILEQPPADPPPFVDPPEQLRMFPEGMQPA